MQPETLNLKPETSPESMFHPGDLLGVQTIAHWYNPFTWIQWRIQVDTHSKLNHIGILDWNCQLHQWFVIEALLKGVTRTPLSDYTDYLSKYNLWVGRIPNLTAENMSAIVETVRGQIGKPYSLSSVVKLRLLQLILGHDAVAQMRIDGTASDQGIFCSRLIVNAVFKCTGVFLGGDFVAPDDVMAKTSIIWWSGDASFASAEATTRLKNGKNNPK